MKSVEVSQRKVSRRVVQRLDFFAACLRDRLAGGRLLIRFLFAALALAAAVVSPLRLLCHCASLSEAIRAIERRVSTDMSSCRGVIGIAGTFDFASSHIGFACSLFIRKM